MVTSLMTIALYKPSSEKFTANIVFGAGKLVNVAFRSIYKFTPRFLLKYLNHDNYTIFENTSIANRLIYLLLCINDVDQSSIFVFNA